MLQMLDGKIEQVGLQEGELWHYAKDCDEGSTFCYEEGAKNHSERKSIAEDEAGKEYVPQKRYCPGRSKNDD